MKISHQFIVLILVLLGVNAFAVSVDPSRSLIVRHSESRSVNPGEFPLFSYIITNTSEKTIYPEFQIIKPDEWNLITFSTPDSIPSLSKARVRVTLNIPNSTKANIKYYLKLFTSFDGFTDSSATQIAIKPKRNIKVGFLEKRKSVFPAAKDSLSFIIKNTGNVLDTVNCNVVLPPHWNFNPQLEKSFILKPFTQKHIKLYFETPIDVQLQNQYTIRIETGTNWNTERIIQTIPVKLIQAPKALDRSLGIYLPVNMGFSFNRIQKGYYPDTEIYLETGNIKMGRSQILFESTLKSNLTRTNDTPEFYMHRYKLGLQNKYSTIRLGDSSLLLNPLLADLSITQYSNLFTFGQLSRGGFLNLKLDDYSVILFKGKKLYKDDRFFYSSLKFKKNEISLSTEYFKADTASFITSSSILGNSAHNISIYTGLSRAENKPTSGAAQVQFKTNHKKYYLTGALHWADDTFQGTDRGTYGALLTSRYAPVSRFYIWNSIHRYNKDLNSIYPDSLENVTDIKLRTFLRIPYLFDTSSSFNFKDVKTEQLQYTDLKSFEIALQRKIGVFIPFLGFRSLEDRLNSLVYSNTQRYSAGLNMFYYLSRFKFEYRSTLQKKYENTDQYILDFDTNIKGFLFGFSLTTGYLGYLDDEGIFSKVKLTYGSVRTGLQLHPFNNNYNLRFELSNSISELDMLTREWRLSATMTSTILPRFNVPVPFIKTKGTLQGEIYIDKNQNGIREPDEPGLSQLLLHFNDETVISSSNGEFEFSPVDAGDYEFKIDVSTLPAYLQIQGEYEKIISINRGSVIHLQIPLTSVCLIEGNVFLDLDNNHKFNGKDDPLNQIRVMLENEMGLLREIFTNANGYYKFTDLVPGFYRVKIDKKWLPLRTFVDEPFHEFVLTMDQKMKKVDFTVKKKKLEIRKTFTPSKNKGN